MDGRSQATTGRLMRCCCCEERKESHGGKLGGLYTPRPQPRPPGNLYHHRSDRAAPTRFDLSTLNQESTKSQINKTTKQIFAFLSININLYAKHQFAFSHVNINSPA